MHCILLHEVILSNGHYINLHYIKHKFITLHYIKHKFITVSYHVYNERFLW